MTSHREESWAEFSAEVRSWYRERLSSRERARVNARLYALRECDGEPDDTVASKVLDSPPLNVLHVFLDEEDDERTDQKSVFYYLAGTRIIFLSVGYEVSEEDIKRAIELFERAKRHGDSVANI